VAPLAADIAVVAAGVDAGAAPVEAEVLGAALNAAPTIAEPAVEADAVDAAMAVAEAAALAMLGAQ
jgi:hypothetical protein